ncbi:MAG: peroxiredoxin family protein [Armatimonadota bacterium]
MWLLGILVVIGSVLGGDILLRTMPRAPASPAGLVEATGAAARSGQAGVPEITRPVGKGLPIGSLAPDFELPDLQGKAHHLSEFRGKPVLMAFYCGCARCNMLAQILSTVLEEIPGEKPHNLVVTSIDPAALPRWSENAGFDGTFLLEKRNGSVATQYDGEACPRVYVLDKELRVRHVTPSPELEAGAQMILNPLAKALGSKWRVKGQAPGAPV